MSTANNKSIIDINEIIKESREKRLRIEEQENLEYQEKHRLRTFIEAEKIVNSWKDEFKNNKKNLVKISICREYNSYLDRHFYKLRCFIDGVLHGIYNIDESAGLNLISGLEANELGGMQFYTLFNNKL